MGSISLLRLGAGALDSSDAERIWRMATEKDPKVEALADYAHEAWSGWMKYLFSRCTGPTDDGGLVIPRESVDRWLRQSNTPYSELPWNEQESDREEARKMLEVIDES